jgi:predicted short-subunit dehydrogenase-like oxidoreductase (DUF2520 family)
VIRIVIIGSGNIAQAIMKSCSNKDLDILGIFGRNVLKAFELAKQLETNCFENITEIPTNADLYLICVNDDAIKEVANNLPILDGLVVHCSGLKPMSELNNQINQAVFWPIESINKNSFTDFKNTPICIEANSEENYRIIEAFADRLSKNVNKISSAERQYLHLAATITNNFSNHLIALAKQELDLQQLDYTILQHLLTKAINNSFNFEPSKIQTGPAIRNDLSTMQKHLSLLQNTNTKDLYELMSKSIFELKENNHA